MRRCVRCGETKGVTAFYQYKHYINAWCVKCAESVYRRMERDYPEILKEVLSDEEYKKYVKED